MRRNPRHPLLLARGTADDDDATWLLTFSDLVLLLLAFVTLSVGTDRTRDRLADGRRMLSPTTEHAPPPATAFAHAASANVGAARAEPAPVIAPPPARTADRLLRLRALAERARGLLAADGLMDVAPRIVEERRIVLVRSERRDANDAGPRRDGRPVTHALDALTRLRPALGLDVAELLRRGAGAPSSPDRARSLHRAVDAARTLTDTEGALEVRVVAATGMPAVEDRIEIRPARP